MQCPFKKIFGRVFLFHRMTADRFSPALAAARLCFRAGISPPQKWMRCINIAGECSRGWSSEGDDVLKVPHGCANSPLIHFSFFLPLQSVLIILSIFVSQSLCPPVGCSQPRPSALIAPCHSAGGVGTHPCTSSISGATDFP